MKAMIESKGRQVVRFHTWALDGVEDEVAIVLEAMSPGQSLTIEGVEYICLPLPPAYLVGLALDTSEGVFHLPGTPCVLRKEDAKTKWEEYSQTMNALLA